LLASPLAAFPNRKWSHIILSLFIPPFEFQKNGASILQYVVLVCSSTVSRFMRSFFPRLSVQDVLFFLM
jgi:hypothetical protein